MPTGDGSSQALTNHICRLFVLDKALTHGRKSAIFSHAGRRWSLSSRSQHHGFVRE